MSISAFLFALRVFSCHKFMACPITSFLHTAVSFFSTSSTFLPGQTLGKDHQHVLPKLQKAATAGHDFLFCLSVRLLTVGYIARRTHQPDCLSAASSFLERRRSFPFNVCCFRHGDSQCGPLRCRCRGSVQRRLAYLLCRLGRRSLMCFMLFTAVAAA